MDTSLDIVFIGAGNVASHLAPQLMHAGHRISQVYSRTMESAAKLASRLSAQPTHTRETIRSQADLYILALTDEGILEFISEFEFPGGIMVHTSGGLEMKIFEGKSSHFGVLYPLQTFNKHREMDFKSIPILVEGSDQATEDLLVALSGQLSRTVRRIGSQHRMILHLAAVFACNFTNHMFDISARLVRSKGLEFDLLKPLIMETAQQIMEEDPQLLQTGPAARNDQKVIEKHLDLLSFNPLLRDIYQLLSESIRKRGSDMESLYTTDH